MSIEVKLPELGENITQGTVTKVLVKAGDSVKKGQNILELETDKAVVEVPCQEQGVVQEVLIQAGAVVKVGQAILKIASGATTAAVVAAPSPGKPAPPIPSASSAPRPVSQSTPIASAVPSQESPAPTAAVHMPVRKGIAAAPSVRLFAREIGVDLGLVPGSGPGGRISIADVKAYTKKLLTSGAVGAGAAVAAVPLPDFSKWGAIERKPMNNVRKKTAEHLSHAWTTIPHVTQFDKADLTELEKLRKNASTPTRKTSITPFLIKIIAEALKKFPQFNTSVDMAASEVVYKNYYNVGVAVDTDRGLLVPVIKNIDQKSVAQIADELGAMAERARLKKTTIEEMQGGGFTISNLGGIGGTYFTPIVNWPEVAILGVSRGGVEPVYVDGMFVPRLLLPLSLSYDHRIIDGADGARFIRWVCEAIQKPDTVNLK